MALIFLEPDVLLASDQRAREPNYTKIVPISAFAAVTEILLAKASNMAKPKVKGQGYSASPWCGCGCHYREVKNGDPKFSLPLQRLQRDDYKFIREILTSKIRTRKNKGTSVHSIWLIRNVTRDRNWGCPGDPCLVSITEYSGAMSVQKWAQPYARQSWLDLEAL